MVLGFTRVMPRGYDFFCPCQLSAVLAWGATAANGAAPGHGAPVLLAAAKPACLLTSNAAAWLAGWLPPAQIHAVVMDLEASMAEVGANQRHANHGIYVLCKAVRWATRPLGPCPPGPAHHTPVWHIAAAV